jgi:hypothetical protein
MLTKGFLKKEEIPFDIFLKIKQEAYFYKNIILIHEIFH